MSCGILPSYFIYLYCILHPLGHRHLGIRQTPADVIAKNRS